MTAVGLADRDGTEAGRTRGGLSGFVRSEGDACELHLLVDGAHCAGCIATIEGRLTRDPAVERARLNLSLRQLAIRWHGDPRAADRLAGIVEALGYRVAPFLPERLARVDERTGRDLLRALAVAAFASSNVMMLSLAVWIGQAGDMGPATQHLLQWLAALVTIPAVAIAGLPFFRSAVAALGAGRTNIDVPIAAGILLTTVISLVELIREGRDVYFDSTTALLFVLLIGRYLDFRVRAKARSAVEHLLLMKAGGALVCRTDGTVDTIPADAVLPGMTILVPAGERLPVDGVVLDGSSELDVAIVTGESAPRRVSPGERVLAGSVNGLAALRLRATETIDRSHLAEMVRLTTEAELRRGRVVTLSDRVAGLWTPVVHGIALLTFAGWWLLAGAGVATALLHAVSVLIIACPCAIGLAIPAVQVVATGALLRRGVLVRSGDALERLATIDGVAFDKTGTLTSGALAATLSDGEALAMAAAASLAAASRHPAAQTIRRAWPGVPPVGGAVEHPGLGVSAPSEGGEMRLGRAFFCGVSEDDGDTGSAAWFCRPGHAPLRIALSDRLRDDARTTVAAFAQHRIPAAILSGDRAAAVSEAAGALGVEAWHSGLLPEAKVAFLEARRAEGRRLLMVGDGLNDAPALAAAEVSASFTHGAPASQVGADIVLPAARLSAIVSTWIIARRSLAITRENLILAALYNAVLIPVAVLGLVTPLGAAIAMAASSLTVTLNALRVGLGVPEAAS